MRVLIIDDEPVIRSLVAAVLMDAGFEVGTAADGESGLRAASSLLPHVILLDVGLPGINGWEALRALRERPETYRTPVIVLSGLLDREEAAAAAALAAGTLAKPFTPEQLLDAVRGVSLAPAA